MIYLDHAATTPLLPEVKQKLQEIMELEFGNAAALHSPGQTAHQLIEEARAEVAQLINAEPGEIIFTSGGSEGNNTIMHSFAGQEIMVSAIEHPSVLESAKAYTNEPAIIPVDEWGRVSSNSISPHAKLVSVMLANNELGTIEPIKELAKHAHSNQSLFHTDATQALGKIPIDVKDLEVDYLTCSAHKIGGPLGVGAIYVRKGAPFTPLIHGGHQENHHRAGTSNVLGIAGFGAAASHTREQQTWRTYAEKVKHLRDQLRQRILTEIPHSSANSPEEDCLPELLNMSFRAAEGESIQLYLDAAGIAVSTGSACAAGDIQPSHVLMATKHDAEIAHSSIRFSLGLETTQPDIDAVMQVLPKIIQRLQGISTIQLGA